MCRRAVAIVVSAAMNCSVYVRSSSFAGTPAHDSDESAEALIRVGRMRHENQLVRRMKGDERACVPRAAEQIAEPGVCEHAFDEVLAQPRI